MKLVPRSLRWPLLLVGLLSLIALAACTQPEAADPETPPTESPPAAPATPTAGQDVPTADFISEHAAISEEWDAFHDDFDQWSAGLSSCYPDAMYLALNDFAVSFNAVTEQARNLTRGSTGGELADLLITAAEEGRSGFPPAARSLAAQQRLAVRERGTTAHEVVAGSKERGRPRHRAAGRL